MSSDLIEQALRRFLVLGQAMRRDAETLPVSVAQSAVLARLRDARADRRVVTLVLRDQEIIAVE